MLKTLFFGLVASELTQEAQLQELKQASEEWHQTRRRVEDASCAENTRWYDDVFQSFHWYQDEATQESFDGDLSDAALWIIDMQKDFTYGNFGFACFDDVYTLRTLPAKIAKFAELFAARGGHVIASKDYHPDDHCSFEGQPDCVQPNKFIQPIKYQHMEMRYQNDFVEHCPFNKSTYAPLYNCCNNYTTTAEACTTCPTRPAFVATQLHEDLGPTMDRLYKAGNASIAFKGMNSTCDSFSAFQMDEPGTDVYHCTGGWSIPATRANYSDRANTNLDSAVPSADQMEAFPTGWLSARDMLQGKKRIFVSGVVFDFCVKDTSMYTTLNLGNETEVFVLTDLSRPSLDGLGPPYAAVPSFDFTLGTAQKSIAAAGDMLRGGVKFVTSSQMMCNNVGLLDVDGSCSACEELHSGCESCNTYGTCMTTKDGHFMDANSDVYACTDNCFSCTDAHKCKLCTDGYSLDSSNACAKNPEPSNNESHEGLSKGSTFLLIALILLVVGIGLRWFYIKKKNAGAGGIFGDSDYGRMI